MRQKLPIIIFWIFFLAMILVPIFAEYSYVFEDMQLNPFDYARITEVEYKAVVVDEPDSEGKVVITERLTFDIHAASKDNLFWELWRDLPEDYVDGVKVHYKVNSVKQILEDGTEVIYEESPKLYWDDEDYVSSNPIYGPGKWYHSEGPYNEEYERYECVFFYVDGLYREEVVFEIEYEMYNAALKYDDCSDLYIALYSGSTVNHLESFEAEILFPEDDMPERGNYDVFTYGTDANEFPVKESDTRYPGYHTFYFDLDEEDLQFSPYNQYIEFDLVSYNEDKHIFTEHAPSNYYTSDEVLDEIYDEQEAYASTPEKFAAMKSILFVVLVIFSIIVLFKAFRTEKKLKEKFVFYNPTVNYDFYRDIPSDLDPNFATTLVFCKHKAPTDDSGIYSAILLSLARKKYIKIEEWGSKDIKVTILHKPIPMSHKGTPLVTDEATLEAANAMEPLTRCERFYFNLIVRHAPYGQIPMSDFHNRVAADYDNTDRFAKDMKYSIQYLGTTNGYFQRAEYNQPRQFMLSSAKAHWVWGILIILFANGISYFTRMDLAFGGYFIFGLACMLASIIKKKKASKFVLLTQFGQDEYAKWRGLYNFLNSNTLIRERTIIELPLWEKYLVYATAFGLSKKVIKAMNIRCPEAATNVDTIVSKSSYSSRRFHRSSRSFSSSVRSGSRGHGGGGGFGYGGGGRGGGGGGGGH